MDSDQGHTGLKIACLVFLFPFFPHNALNYCMGLTHLSTKHFFISNTAKLVDSTALIWIGSTIATLSSANDVKKSL
jgi:uncharacterized membrane protein YdjX (TVP38/TMEM64 family)